MNNWTKEDYIKLSYEKNWNKVSAEQQKAENPDYISFRYGYLAGEIKPLTDIEALSAVIKHLKESENYDYKIKWQRVAKEKQKLLDEIERLRGALKGLCRGGKCGQDGCLCDACDAFEKALPQGRTGESCF